MVEKSKSRRKADDKELNDTERAERDGAVRRINRQFGANLPSSLLGSGVYEVPEDEVKAAEKVPVPDGMYRVLGSDLILGFKGNKHIGVFKARPDVDASEIIEVA